MNEHMSTALPIEQQMDVHMSTALTIEQQMNEHMSTALPTEQQILVACNKDVTNKANRCTRHTFTTKLIVILGQHTRLPIKSTVASGDQANLIKYGKIRTHCQEKVGHIREPSQHQVWSH